MQRPASGANATLLGPSRHARQRTFPARHSSGHRCSVFQRISWPNSQSQSHQMDKPVRNPHGNVQPKTLHHQKQWRKQHVQDSYSSRHGQGTVQNSKFHYHSGYSLPTEPRRNEREGIFQNSKAIDKGKSPMLQEDDLGF
jgi:hypothetical protein